MLVKPWPNRLGHDVYAGRRLVGEVWDDPIVPGVRVRTVLPDPGSLTGYRGERWLEIPTKTEPVEAVLRCRREGRPCED